MNFTVAIVKCVCALHEGRETIVEFGWLSLHSWTSMVNALQCWIHCPWRDRVLRHFFSELRVNGKDGGTEIAADELCPRKSGLYTALSSSTFTQGLGLEFSFVRRAASYSCVQSSCSILVFPPICWNSYRYHLDTNWWIWM